MATIEIYGAAKIENWYCCYCGFDMTIQKFCIDCNEYKSAVTLQEYYEMNGHYPRLRAVK